jgi:hypothetical protein
MKWRALLVWGIAIHYCPAQVTLAAPKERNENVSHSPREAWGMVDVGLTLDQESGTQRRVAGVEISTPDLPVLPKEWPSDTYPTILVKLDTGLRSKALTAVASILRQYPERVLGQCVEKIELVGALRCRDLNPSGANCGHTIILGCAGLKEDELDIPNLRQTFHHEFSCLLFNRYPEKFPTKKWMSANPVGFRYRDNEILTPEYNTGVNEKDAGDGFACSYGRVCMQKDFATIVENLFEPAADFKILLGRYPHLREKAILAMSFYVQIDPQLLKLLDPEVVETLCPAAF